MEEKTSPGVLSVLTADEIAAVSGGDAVGGAVPLSLHRRDFLIMFT
jgi:hypothetical protein